MASCAFKHRTGYVLALASSVLVNATIAFAQPATRAQPSFDCAKNLGPVEKLICSTPGLAMLDHETARLFDLAKAGGAELIASQRAWIDKRNDCASSTDKQRCIAESFVQRISQLREQYPAARKSDNAGISLGPFNVSCENFGTPIIVTFVNSDPAYAYIGWQSNFVVLKQAMSGSGALYEAQYPKGQSRLRNKGNSATIAFPGGRDMTCTLKPV